MYGSDIDFERMDTSQIIKVFEPFNGTVSLGLVGKYANAMLITKSEKKIFARNLAILYSKAVRQKIKTKTPFLPILEDTKGSIRLGRFIQGETKFGDCKIEINDLIQTAIIAAPNKGKTRLIFTLIKEILRLNEDKNKTSVIFLDRKQDGRRAGKEFVVLSLEDIFINIFDPPPGCEPRKWMSDVCQLLMSVWQYFQRSRNALLKASYNLYEIKQRPPTILEVYEVLKEEDANSRRTSNRKLEINEVNEDRLENSILEFGKCFTRRKTFPLYEFLDSGIPLVIEADVSNDSFSLILGWLLLYIYRYRKSNNMRGNVSENGAVLVCDEAFLLWEKAREWSESRRELGADFISTAPLFIRDFKTAIVAASQSVLSSDYMAATNLKIIGYCANYDDAKYLANSLGDPDLTEIILRLGVGQFIIKIGDKKPALLQTEDYPLETVDNSQLKERMKIFVDYIEERTREIQEERTEEPKETARLSRDAKNLLVDALTYPESTISARYSRLGLKGAKAQDVVEEILDAKYADLVFEPIESFKAAKYLVLTQQAIDWLRSQDLNVSQVQHIGRVGPVHSLYQNILQVYLRRSGWKVTHDYQVGEKFVDVYAEKTGRKSAFEICINEAVNVARVVSSLDLVDEYIFLCRDIVTANAVRSQVNIQNSKIKYFVANQYITALKSSVSNYYSYKNENSQDTQNKQNSGSFTSEQPENRSE